MNILHQHSSEHYGRHNPIPRIMPDSKVDTCAVLTAGSSCVVGQGPVDDQCLCAVDLGNGNERLVQAGIASVTDEVIQVLLVVILIATTGTAFLAQTCNREGGIGTVGVGRVGFTLVDKAVARGC